LLTDPRHCGQRLYDERIAIAIAACQVQRARTSEPTFTRAEAPIDAVGIEQNTRPLALMRENLVGPG